ncbi:hypothetical protein AAG570_004105 [Ranatra chinensis]|uniref:Lipase domain-containing protein n=1 Tax=Ranatra chinensis TaxID=642074 RepID=A0ABD0Y537_9HEMI
MVDNMFDIAYWRCVIKRTNLCPDKDIKLFFYNSQGRRKQLDVRSRTPLRYAGWDEHKKNVLIIHGFNSTERNQPMSLIRDAYLRRGDYNVFTIDWETIGFFPCYLSSLSNTRLVAQCSAQFYSYLTSMGVRAQKTVCVGHSLGAHICGMMNNHLSQRMHKIIGLDPARPLVRQYGGRAFRLTKDDANVVQIIHTNAGLLGDLPIGGHVDFCVNGGHMQPECRREGRRIRQARCSHFMSGCYFSAFIGDGREYLAAPCTKDCRKITNLEKYSIPLGEHTPETLVQLNTIIMRDNVRKLFGGNVLQGCRT